MSYSSTKFVASSLSSHICGAYIYIAHRRHSFVSPKTVKIKINTSYKGFTNSQLPLQDLSEHSQEELRVALILFSEANEQTVVSNACEDVLDGFPELSPSKGELQFKDIDLR